MYFCSQKAEKLKLVMSAIQKKLLSNFAFTSSSAKYWLSADYKRTTLRLVIMTMTLGKYSPVRPSRSVSKN